MSAPDVCPRCDGNLAADASAFLLACVKCGRRWPPRVLADEAKRNERALAVLLQRTEGEADELRQALAWLVALKAEKDERGKTPRYLEEQPRAWEHARAVLGILG